jgi:hypothetical protein
MKIGDRVGAIFAETDKRVEFLGYGSYAGDFVPETAGGFLAEIAKIVESKNPKIFLDSGKVVWGCECWWGPEEEIKKHLEGREIIQVDIDDLRKKVQKKVDKIRKEFLGEKNANKIPGQDV